MSWIKKYGWVGFVLGIYTIFYVYTIDYGFFWDTVQLGSKHAHFYFETGFSSLLLPENMDSGHIPAFGMYLAAWWKVLGRNLIVSHLAMLPFVAGLLLQLMKLCRRWVSPEYLGLLFSIVALDPTLLAQCTLVSPDVVLIFFFLAGINMLLDKKWILLSLCFLGLVLTSNRGVILVAALVLSPFLSNIKSWNSIEWKPLLLSALPSALLFIAYQGYHYSTTGWIGHHEGSPWAESFQEVSLSGIIKNMGLFGWRLIDFGRVAFLIPLLFVLMKFPKWWKQHLHLSRILILATLLILIVILPHSGLIGHRYVLPINLIGALFVTSLFLNLDIKRRTKFIVSSTVIVSLLLGHFLIYPQKVAQGWDASLAYLPYEQLRTKMDKKITVLGIDPSEICTGFPNKNSRYHIDLSDDKRPYSDINEADCPYILYSNMYNDFSDQQIDDLQNLEVIEEYKNGRISITLYKNNSRDE